MVTAFALTYAVAAPTLAAFTSRQERKLVLTALLALFAVANLACALAPSLGLLLVGRVVAAVAAAAFTPTASAAAVALVGPELRGRAMAVILGGLAEGRLSPQGVWFTSFRNDRPAATK